jgi:hypothetical protein
MGHATVGKHNLPRPGGYGNTVEPNHSNEARILAGGTERL